MHLFNFILLLLLSTFSLSASLPSMPTQAEDGELISFCETHGYLITVTYPGSLTTFEIPSGKQVGAFQINTPYLDVLLQVHPMWLDQIGVAALFCDFPAADARESEGSFSL